MTYDTLTYNGIEKAFSDWGIKNPEGNKINQQADTFTATLAEIAIASEATNPTFPFEAVVTIQSNRSFTAGGAGGGMANGVAGTFSGGTIKFQGKAMQPKGKVDASGSAAVYTFKGPLYDLSQVHYQQTYRGGNNQVYIGAETVLNTSTAVPTGQAFISVGDQIQAIAQWLLDAYAQQNMAAPFQYIGRALNTTTIAPGQTAIVPTGAIDLTSAAGTYNYHVKAGNTIATDLYTLFFPSYITKPLMCAEAIQKCLELLPLANVWFDYTVSPPMLHVSTPMARRNVSLPIMNGVDHKSLNITRRDDLKVRAVNIGYRISSQINGQTQVDYVNDQWGQWGSNSYWNIFYAQGPAAANAAVKAGTADPITGLRVMSELIDLQGFNATVVRGYLDCQPLACRGTTQAQKRAWWSSKRGGDTALMEDWRLRFQDTNGAQTFIPDAKFYYATAGVDQSGVPVTEGQEFTWYDYGVFTSRIVRGAATPWMTLPGNVPIVTVKAKVSATMTYGIYVNVSGTNSDTDTTGQKVFHADSKDHHINMELTNGVSNAYTTVTSNTPGETYIIGAGGIAQYLYNQLNVYQYDGETVSVKAAFDDSTSPYYIDLGANLNLSNGANQWQTMAAQIQSIQEDYTNHYTKVTIGVAKQLNAGQFQTILNAWRFRRPWYAPALRTNNALGGGGLVDGAVTAGNAANMNGLSVQSYLALHSDTDANNAGVTNTIEHNAPTNQTTYRQSDTGTGASIIAGLGMIELTGAGAPNATLP